MFALVLSKFTLKGLSIYIALYTYTKYTVYTLNLHQIYTCFIVYFTHDKKTGEIHLLFDI